MQTLTVGELELTIVSGGSLRGDGGAMFGIIPRALWARVAPPDENNNILMETNCLLVRTPDSLGLIDSGYGDKLPEKVLRRGSMQAGAPLLRSLAEQNVAPEDLDWVIQTHLHFDHAGGLTTVDESGTLRPVFPRARHYIQAKEWEDAVAQKPELEGAYLPANFEPLQEAGLVELVDEQAEIVPGITVQRTDGHTRGHQMVTLTSQGKTAVYLGDVCPMAGHVRALWTMAYDQYPLTTRITKPQILGAIADQQQVAILGHEPTHPIVRLHRDPKLEFRLEPVTEV